MGPGRVERPTSRLSGVRSNHLSYEPDEVHFSMRARSNSRDTATAARVRPARRFDGKEGKRGRRQGAERQNTETRGSERSTSASVLLSKLGEETEGHRLAPLIPVFRIRFSESRKEVIQPQVPLRLPCYDFGPVADPTVAGCLLAVSAPSSGKTNSHAVTGGVYKARERIHRSLLFCDY